MSISREFQPNDEWQQLPLVVLDFETTGLSWKDDRIVEVGVVHYDGGQISNQYDWRVNPGIWVPDDVVAVHGISASMSVYGTDQLKSLTDLWPLLKGRLPVAHKAPFDRGMLHATAERLGCYRGQTLLPPALDRYVEWIDTQVWGRYLLEMPTASLVELCGRYDIVNEKPHAAVQDAHAAGRLLWAMAPSLPPQYGTLIQTQASIQAAQKVGAAIRARMPPPATS